MISKIRAHIEVFRIVDGTRELVRADNRDEHPQYPVQVITYTSPQRRIAIYGNNDRTFNNNLEFRNKQSLIIEGTWEQCLPVFEDYARMI